MGEHEFFLTNNRNTNLIGRALSKVAKTIAPVIFDPDRRGRFTLDIPIDPRINDVAQTLNIEVSQFANDIIPNVQNMLRNIQTAGDNLTDIISEIPPGETNKALVQAQELLDLPTWAVLESLIRTLAIFRESNAVVIAKIRKGRQRKRRKQ